MAASKLLLVASSFSKNTEQSYAASLESSCEKQCGAFIIGFASGRFQVLPVLTTPKFGLVCSTVGIVASKYFSAILTLQT